MPRPPSGRLTGVVAVLGGLSRNSKVSERSGIPGLKEIPGVRDLFSRQVERTHQSQILVTIELERKPSGSPAAVASAEMLPPKEASSTEE